MGVEFFDPLAAGEKQLIVMCDGEYTQVGDLIYVKTAHSNCILTLKIEGKELLDAVTKERVGRVL